jgi:transcriptional regulator with XRE-family HTH domain
MEFSEWITQKYIEWRGNKVGKAGSIAEFAKQFGVSQPLMSQWMKKGGKVPKSHKYINALLRAYGDEAYEPLGLRVETEPLPADKIPADLRDRLDAAQREINMTLEQQRIEPDSPEETRIVIEIMERHGFIYTGTE